MISGEGTADPATGWRPRGGAPTFPGMPSRSSRVAAHPLTLALSWTVAVAALAWVAGRFWIPLDDGTLAQSAERVLGGELPHRDFGDPYTGLNAVLGAAAFRLLGVELPSLRVPLVAGYALWLPAVWLVARRLARPVPALVATALAAVASVGTYPAAMPGWFGLFLATWGLWCLLRFLDSENRGWLVGVGLAAGVSILFKVTGLYFLAAVLLTLAWHRAGSAGRRPEGGVRAGPDEGAREGFSTWRIPVYPAAVATGVLAFWLLLGRLLVGRAGLAGLVHFLLPGVVLGAALVARSWRAAGRAHHPSAEGPLGAPLQALLADGVVLLSALAFPVLLFLLPYAESGSVGLWVEGVFLLPSTRFASAASGAGSPGTVVPGLVGVAVLALSGRVRGVDRPRLAAALAIALLAAVTLDDVLDGAVLASFWYGVRSWTPWLMAWGAHVALRRAEADGADASALFAVVAVAGLWALVQFPYASPAYVFYLLPLTVLATLAVTGRTAVGHGPVTAVPAALLLVLAGAYVGGVAASGEARLPGERGGLLVSAEDARVYGDLVTGVERRAEPGDTLWAGPDAPEIYFLTGRPNPGPVLYEFLGAPGRPETTRAGPPPGTRVAVLHTRPLFSPAPSAALRADLEARGFRRVETVGPFELHVRERAAPDPGEGGGS